MMRGETRTTTQLLGKWERIARIMSRNHGVRVVLTGLGARTDGEGVIYIPANADHLRAADQAVLEGMLDHETAHVMEEEAAKRIKARDSRFRTPMDIMRAAPDKRHALMQNVYEDLRIERVVGAKYPGMAENLAKLHDHMFDRLAAQWSKGDVDPDWWWQLGVTIIYKAQGRTPSFVPEALVKVVDEHLSDLVGKAYFTETAEDCWELAKETIARVGSLRAEADRKIREAREKRAEEARKAEEAAKAEMPEPMPEFEDVEEESEPEGDEGDDEAGEDEETEAGSDDDDETPGMGDWDDEMHRADEERAEAEAGSDGEPSTPSEPEEATEPSEEAPESAESVESMPREEAADRLERKAAEEEAARRAAEEAKASEEPKAPGEDDTGDGAAPGEGEDGESEDAHGDDDGEPSDDGKGGKESDKGEASPKSASGGSGPAPEAAASDDGEPGAPVAGSASGEGTEGREGEASDETDDSGEGMGADELRGALDGSEEDAKSGDMLDTVRRDLREAAEEDARAHKRWVPHPEAVARDKWVVGPDFPEAKFQALRETVQAQVHALRAKITTVLRARSEERWEGDKDSGPLDTTALYRLRLGDKRVFKHHVPGQPLDTAIEILVDESGSMSSGDHKGTAAYFARMTTIAMSECLAALKIPFEVVGFTNDGSDFSDSEGLTTRSMAFRFIIYKSFEERAEKTRTRLCGITGREQNVDGEAVWQVARRLAARKESRKILFVLSDGAPCGGGDFDRMQSHLREVIKRITAAGIEVYGIGMGSRSAVEKFYVPKNGSDHIKVEDLDKLAFEVFKLLRRRLVGTGPHGRV